MTILKIDEGVHDGVKEITHFEGDDQIVIQQSFDAQPHLDYAASARQQTAGQNWGSGKLIGHIPPAFYARILTIKGRDERGKAIQKFFQQNPAFVMFDRYLKKT
jgi:hypothetical protein